jgi:uncharacterized protein (DUF934 family)
MPTLLEFQGARSREATDAWHFIAAGETLPATGHLLLPFDRWCEEARALASAGRKSAAWVDTDVEPETLAPHLHRLPMVAIRFAAFNDGRGLSLATLLRTRCGYTGELRAIGAVHEDIIHYIVRCGFDSVVLAEGRNLDVARRGATVMSDYYQGSVIDPQPAFRRRARGG